MTDLECMRSVDVKNSKSQRAGGYQRNYDKYSAACPAENKRIYK